jgi:hypothetical protein
MIPKSSVLLGRARRVVFGRGRKKNPTEGGRKKSHDSTVPGGTKLRLLEL